MRDPLLGLAQPTISKHLKLLEEAELVESYKDKLWVNYRLAEAENSLYADAMLDNLRKWLQDDPEISALQLKSLQVNRETICNK